MNKLWMACGLMIVAMAIASAQDKSAAKPDAKPELVSPLGVKFFAKTDEKGAIAKAEAKLATDQKNIDLYLALGRAQAECWRYHDAIATYTRAVAIAPDDARLYRHRGHRYISTRQFPLAVADLKKAATIDKQSFDIWYHLGLAHYLRGDFVAASQAYEKCYEVARNKRDVVEKSEGRDDSLVAVSDWLYMTYRRLERPKDADRILEAITPQLEVKENKSYFKRLLFYKGIVKEEELFNAKELNDSERATVGYGVANWHLYNGNHAKAEEHFRRIVGGSFWPAFGFIAAEAELQRTIPK